MAKMTLTDLKTQAVAYVAAAKQAGAFSATTNNLIGLVDKIGKIVMLDGTFTDKLPEFDGENLPLGKTIEEYFIDLIAPSTYDATGANNDAPSYLLSKLLLIPTLLEERCSRPLRSMMTLKELAYLKPISLI